YHRLHFFELDSYKLVREKCYLTNLSIKIDLDQSRVDNRFFYYHFLNTGLRHLDSGSAQSQITINDLNNEVISLPPLSEQKSIAHILGSLDDKIELNRRMNATLEAMARALFKSWFVDFDPVIDNALAAGNPIPEPLQARAKARKALGYQRKPLPAAIQKQFPSRLVFTEEMGWVSEGWKVSTVGEEFNVTMGQSPPGNTYNESGEGVPFFQGRADFGFRYPSNRVYCTAPKRLASKGDTLVSVRAPVGDVNMAAANCCIGRGVSASRHKSGSRSFTFYAMLQLREYFKVFEGEGTVFGSINQKDFKALPMLGIPAELVEEFEVLAGGFDEKIEIGTESVSNLVQLRDTLLPKLISGQLRIPDAEQLLAEVA
ncbi:restriction endonuclease subunit S, partial [Desulfurivibrio sp. D14AmB]|uniref:restriction endonuclease subunit S n=1 Tax=Desulfurivibrio sp. D14AmB TaxID=3374370 RepID=UPI00376EED8B